MAVDTESLCVVTGKLVWSIRIDIHILDNGGYVVLKTIAIQLFVFL